MHRGSFIEGHQSRKKEGMEMQGVQERSNKEGSRNEHVLLVEDEVSIANGLKMVLSEEGYGVDVAMTGLDALKLFKDTGFDLVVSDLRLPDIDGMDVIKAIKQERPDTKVVIITGYPSVSTAVESAKMGVSDYLRKPFTDDDFLAAVSEALTKREEEDAEERFLTETKEGLLIQKREVLNVLNRTYDDHDFWNELMENRQEALEDYQLSKEARTAILSGDLNWINSHVGELNQKQLMFIFKRLESEVW
jgi:DNA-binding response OmpR family regulator